MNRLACLPFAAPLCLAVLAACSSRPVETGRADSAEERPAAVAAQSLAPSTPPSRRPVGPVPEVIAPAKPFRFAEAIGGMEAARPIAGRTARFAAAVTQAAATAPQAAASPATAEDHPDVTGIRRTMHGYLQAFNRHDAAAVAAHWNDSGTNVDLDSGETTSGREAVQEVFAALFEQDATARIDIDLRSIRLLRDDVAVVDGVSRLSTADAPPSSSRFSAVLVRHAAGWRLDSVRESKPAAEVSADDGPDRAPTARPLDELSWLVGSWEDAGEGVTASTQCFWSTNAAFLIRSHAVTIDAVPERRPAPGDSRIPGLLPTGPLGSREITEVIGWDPDRRQIRSWLFTSSGRFAEGSWSRDGDTWTIRIDEGPTGSPTGDCLYTISRVGPDEMTCRCGDDRLAELLPPDCDFLRTARASAPRGPQPAP